MEGRAWPVDEDMDDRDIEAAVDEDEGFVEGDKESEQERDLEGKDTRTGQSSRQGKWESGAGRCAITGRKILGGTEGLRRVVV